MAIPSIKGSVFASVVEDVVRLMEEGVLDRDEVEQKLSSDVSVLLGETISPAMWYSVEAYGELTELLVASEGNGDMQYMYGRGAAAAERLIEAGLYQQATFADELSGGARDMVASVARLIVTIAPAMFNFTKWTIEIDTEDKSGFSIRVAESAEMPQTLRVSAAGFAHTLAERALGSLDQTTEQISDSEFLMVHRYLD